MAAGQTWQRQWEIPKSSHCFVRWQRPILSLLSHCFSIFHKYWGQNSKQYGACDSFQNQEHWFYLPLQFQAMISIEQSVPFPSYHGMWFEWQVRRLRLSGIWGCQEYPIMCRTGLTLSTSTVWELLPGNHIYPFIFFKELCQGLDRLLSG